MREGEAAGRSRAAAELQPVIERLARSIEELAGLRARLRSEAEAIWSSCRWLSPAACCAANWLIDPDALHGLVLAALEKLQGAGNLPREGAPLARGHGDRMLAERPRPASNVEVVPDPSREPGAVVFETARGNLDASVESQLQEIERGLADRLRRHS